MASKYSYLTIDGREIKVSNLDKVMYPETGFTKGDVIDYYAAVAPVLLPHIEGRALTRIRFPGGTGKPSFYEKNAPVGTPEWVCTVSVASPGSSKNRAFVNYVLAGDVPTLVWLANLAALELHAPQWRIDDAFEADRFPDRLMADLDPGPPAGMDECIQVALLLRDRFAQDGLTAYPKSSGKKGLHVSCPIAGTQSHLRVSDYAKSVARELHEAYPDLVTAKMAKKLRAGRVFIDWSQNNAAKTTVAPYSLRSQHSPTVSTPLTWEEVESGAIGRFSPEEVLGRVEACGDLLGGLLTRGPKIPE